MVVEYKISIVVSLSCIASYFKNPFSFCPLVTSAWETQAPKLNSSFFFSVFVLFPAMYAFFFATNNPSSLGEQSVKES